MSDWGKEFRVLVGSTKNPRLAVQHLRGKLGLQDPAPAFFHLRGNHIFSSAIAANRAPKEFGKLWSARRLSSRGLLPDLMWTAEVICHFSREIASFIAFEREFELAYIAGDLAQCLDVLDRLEEKHGLSLWLISRKTKILRSVPTSQNVDYTNSLIYKGNNNTSVNWLVYIFGYRSDPNLSPSGYIRQMSDSLDSQNVPNELREFLRYFTLNEPPRSILSCSAVLAQSENAPLIDRYIILLDVIQFLTCCDAVGDADLSVMRSIVQKLTRIVCDDRLALLELIFEGEAGFSNLIARVEVSAADAYTEGNYALAASLLTEAIRKAPGRTDLYNLLARAALRVGEFPELPPPISEIIRNIASVYTFADDDETAAAGLLREQITGAHRLLSCSIRSLMVSRVNDPSLPNLESSIEALNGGRLTPSQLRSLPRIEMSRLMAAAVQAIPGSISIALQRAIAAFGELELDPDLAARLPDERASLYNARSLLHLLRFDQAIAIFREFEDHEIPAVANDARRELFSAYIAAGYVNEGLRVVARAHNSNQKLRAMFRLDEVLDGIEFSGTPPFDQIALSICYHIFNSDENNPRLGAQADAAEEYALSRGGDLPSKINFGEVVFDRELIRSYLDDVCSPPVLDKFMAIEDVGSVELERLEICRILSEIDPANRQRYLDEIRDITRRRVVRDRFEQVERTKIYVDTDGVKRQAEKTLRDAFLRFVASLDDETQSNERIEMMRRVQTIIANVESEGVKIHFTDLPGSERDILFDKLVGDLLRLLVSSQEYGLEAYLSTRVRHGTMGNQLRSAFEVNAILTQKDGGRYQPDYTWTNTLNIEDTIQGGWLSERLAIFSEQIDTAIEDLVRRRVQVRSEVAPDGLFVFQTYNYDTIKLQSNVTPDTPFDTFMDDVIEQFWAVLEGALVAVRSYIEGEFILKIYALADDLQMDLDRELCGLNYSPLQDAIAAARTQMAVNVGTVAGWFTLARDMERPDYEFDIAVEVAIESIRVCHPSLGVALHRADDVGFECRGRSLESLVYMLFTALDNAVEHSGYGDRAPDLLLETSLENGWLSLTLRNSCMPIDDIESANASLVALRERLENASDLQLLATKEGGSGYAKIIRILKHDLLSRYSLEFEYKSESEYEVRIGVESRAIVK